MTFSGVSPTHGNIQSEQPDVIGSNDELAERIVVVALGLISTIGALFALLIIGTPVLPAIGTAVVIGGSISLMTYLNFQHKKNHPDPIDIQSQQIQEEIDRQLQLNADFSQQLQEQEAKKESEAIAYIQKTIEKLNLEKVELDQSFRNGNLNDRMYEANVLGLKCKYQLAFTFGTGLLSLDAKARVLAPYQAAGYSHLM